MATTSGSSVLLSLLSLIAVLNYCHSQNNDGIVISLRGTVIPNHGLVTTSDIDLYQTGSNTSMPLICSTNYTQCCDGADGRSVASWYFAHAAQMVHTIPVGTFWIRRTDQAVHLFRNINPISGTSGIFRCTIPDSGGNEQTKYIGIYTQSGGISGSLSPSTIQFSIMVNEDPVMFNLTFRTIGGPATYVTWTRDDVDITNKDARYTPSQNVIPNVHNGAELYTAGNYDNILTVNGRFSGVYGVSVTNDRTTTPVTASITILDYPRAVITNGSVMQSADGRNVTVTWTVSNSSLVTRYFDGYEIQTRRCPLGHQTTGCDDLQTVRTTFTQYTLTDVPLWVTYEFKIALVNMSNYHYFPGVSGLYLVGIQIGILGILPPEITSVIDITSIQVTWNQPVGGLTVDEYVVSYRHLNGRDGQCSSFQDEGSVIVSAMEERVDHTAILHLQAYSVYTCTVTARNHGSGLYNETTINISTNETVPTGVPQNLAIIDSTSTSVTISWDSVECIHRNGIITHYIISYGPVGDTSGVTNVSINSSGPDNGGSYMATGLDATQNYMFKVAAVNSEGISPFTTVSTNKPIQAPELLNSVLALNATSVQVTWNQPEGLIALEYVVSYRRLNGTEGQCSSFQDEGNVTVRKSMGEILNRATLQLEAYSVYVVNVTGRNGDSRNTSNVIQIETNSTVPTHAPQNLNAANVNSTSVTISWDSVECIHRNGLITQYTVTYGPTSETNGMAAAKEVSIDAGPGDVGGSYTATGLGPTINYNFKVVAVNSVGMGTVFGSITVETEATPTTDTQDGCTTFSAAVAGMASVIVILVLAIAVLSGVNIMLVCWVCRTRSIPQAKDKHQAREGSETQSKPNEAFYEEINIPSNSKAPKMSIEMDTCPAYEVTTAS